MLGFIRWHFHFCFANGFHAGLGVRCVSHCPPPAVCSNKFLKALPEYFFNWRDLKITEKLWVWYKEILFPKRSESELPVACPSPVDIPCVFPWTRPSSCRDSQMSSISIDQLLPPSPYTPSSCRRLSQLWLLYCPSKGSSLDSCTVWPCMSPCPPLVWKHSSFFPGTSWLLQKWQARLGVDVRKHALVQYLLRIHIWPSIFGRSVMEVTWVFFCPPRCSRLMFLK